MFFIPRHGKYIQDFTLNFDLNDQGENDVNNIIPIRRVSEKTGVGPENTSIKVLGFYLDERLNFKNHIDILSKKAFQGDFHYKQG